LSGTLLKPKQARKWDIPCHFSGPQFKHDKIHFSCLNRVWSTAHSRACFESKPRHAGEDTNHMYSKDPGGGTTSTKEPRLTYCIFSLKILPALRSGNTATGKA